jgi:citrate lyase subunit beta/citryl-CoA lyase
MHMLRRSQLYVPANSEKMLTKSTTMSCDSIIIDLEDAVPLSEKRNARLDIKRHLRDLDWGRKEICVRINGISSIVGLEDVVELSSEEKVSTLVIPKAESGIGALHRATSKMLIPIIESSRGFMNIENLVREEGVVAVTYGAGDLALSMGGTVDSYASNSYIRTRIVMTANAYGVDAVDKVFFDLNDLNGFKKEAAEARGLGYAGKQVIHPSQVNMANEVFSPTAEELAWAERVLQAYERASEVGLGAISLDGQLIDDVHHKLAKQIQTRSHEIRGLAQ